MNGPCKTFSVVGRARQTPLNTLPLRAELDQAVEQSDETYWKMLGMDSGIMNSHCKTFSAVECAR